MGVTMLDLLHEPDLEDLYQDEVLHLLLACDGLDVSDVRHAVAMARAGLAGATRMGLLQAAE